MTAGKDRHYLNNTTMRQYKQNKYIGSKLHINTAKEGELLEGKLARMKASKQPVKAIDGMKPMIYTDRADGVHPSHNIRTNKFEVAIEAHDMVAKARAAKRDSKPKIGGPETTDGNQGHDPAKV